MSKLHGMLRAMDAYERRQRQDLLAFLNAQSQVPAHLLEPTAYGDGVNAAVARRNAPEPVTQRYTVTPVFGHAFGHAARIGDQIAMGVTGYAARCTGASGDQYLAREADGSISARTNERGAVPDMCVFASPGDANAAIEASQPTEPKPEPEPKSDEYGYWTRRPDGGLHYHAYDPATEDDELADHLIGGGDMPAQPMTCHRCGAVVDGDALALQTAADGSPRLYRWYCATHLIAGLERLKAALRAQREGEA